MSRLAPSEANDAPRSERFYWSGRNNVGAILAILAAMVNLGVVVWPVVNSFGRGDVDPSWRWIDVLAALAYAAAFFLADTRWNTSRLLLLFGAAIQILAALTLGHAYESVSVTPGTLVGLLDFLPAVMALAAAFLIHRAPTPAEVDLP